MERFVENICLRTFLDNLELLISPLLCSLCVNEVKITLTHQLLHTHIVRFCDDSVYKGHLTFAVFEEDFVRQLIESGTTRLVADFEQLDYVSSAGLGELILTSKLLQEKGGQFSVANVKGNVLSVFEMCGIGSVIKIHRSVADALAAPA